MRRKPRHALAGYHRHFEVRCKEKHVVIQQRLRHLDGQFGSFFGVKFAA